MEVAEGIAMKELVAVKCRLSVVRLTGTARDSVVIPRAAGSESFVYVTQGEAEVSGGATRHKLAADMLLIVPASGGEARLRALGGERTVVVVFTAS
jgi:redox-sensitive bicupin YhaK (pirin superfamily)